MVVVARMLTELREIANSVITHRGQNSAIMEGVRMAALTWTISEYLGRTASDVWSRERPFSALSPAAIRAGVSEREVHLVAGHILDRLDSRQHDAGLMPHDPAELVETLAAIHTVGSTLSPENGRPRRLLGMYPTPLTVADVMVELTVGRTLDQIGSGSSHAVEEEIGDVSSWTFLDPACGTGVFLVAVIRAFLKRRDRLARLIETEGSDTDTFMESLGNRLFGTDIDMAALQISDACISLTLGNGIDNVGSRIGKSLRCGDALISPCSLNERRDLRDLIPPQDMNAGVDWKREFPNVLEGDRMGFDFVLMNPPYDRLKPDRAQFLRECPEHVDHTKRVEVSEKRAWYVRQRVDYFRRCGDYPLSARDSVDLYRLFIERSIALTHEGSRLSMIVPSTLLGDHSSAPLRRELLTRNSIDVIYEFSENARIFPEVTQSVCIVALKRGGLTREVQLSPGLTSLQGIEDAGVSRISVQEIEILGGPALQVPMLNRDLVKILRRIHRFPSLGSLRWLVNRRGEFDLTLDRMFLAGPGEGEILVRGSDVGRFSVRTDTRSRVRLREFVESRRDTRRLATYDDWRLAGQQVSNRTQRWSLKFAAVPPGWTLANSCNYIALRTGPENGLDYICGLLNSSLLNWRFRVTSSNNHVSNREISVLPIPDPVRCDNDLSTLIDEIAEETRRLRGKRPATNPSLDALVFSLYGLDADEALLVMQNLGASYDEIDMVLNTM
ncbi:MAG: Eco57I restriction-modification methylase domain-containing protein [Candidatus Thorarchaeota archaeon]